jgi:hypothetical protein
MTACWKPEPSERITFDMTCHELTNNYDKMNQFSNPSYDPVPPPKPSEPVPYLNVLPD